MGQTCDVCGSQIADDARFCPSCGLEVADEPPQPPRETPLSADRWQWEEETGQRAQQQAGAQDYSLKEQAPDLVVTHDKLQRAAVLLAEGRVRQCAELLQSVRHQLGEDSGARQEFQQLAKAVKDAKADALQRAQRLLDDPDRLLQYITGPAVDQLSFEEVCRLALQAADNLCRRRDAENARRLLRLPAFRQLRNPKLRAEHKRLEELARRRSQREHTQRSLMIFTLVIVAAIPGLWIYLWILNLPTWLLWFIAALAAVALLWGIGPLRQWLRVKLEGEDEDNDEDYEA